MSPSSLPRVARRFLEYVQIDTQSDPDSETVPSTDKQKNLSRMVTRELSEIGAADVEMDEYGYVYATIPSYGIDPSDAAIPVIGLLAHVDTSPEASGAGVQPVLFRDYRGGILELPGDPAVTLDPDADPALANHIGHDLITSDGTTLLGSDDKAGVAVLVEVAARLVEASIPRPRIRLCFTVDEEIGRGVDHLDIDRFGADVAYTLDGSGTDVVYVETFNAVEATVRAEGVVVHPGYAKDKLVNAVQIIAEFIDRLPEDEAPSSTDGREGYFYPYRLHGGRAQEASVDVLLRDFTREGMRRRRRLLTQLTDLLNTKYSRGNVSVTFTEQYDNMRRFIDETDPRVITRAEEAARDMDMKLTLGLVRGGTDGARLSALGIPTPNIFTGGHQFHSLREWNTVQNLERALEYTLTLMQCWATSPSATG